MSLGIPAGDLLMRLLDASSLRKDVLASNLSNQNTPGYRRQTVRFEELVEEALASGRGDPRGVRPMVETDTRTPARADGNNVNLELELGALGANRLAYESYLAMMLSLIHI